MDYKQTMTALALLGLAIVCNCNSTPVGAQDEEFVPCFDEEREPPKAPPLRPFPNPGLAVNVTLARDGLVVNDTGADHVIVLDCPTINKIEVTVRDRHSARLLVRYSGNTADVIARGGICHVYAQRGNDIVRNYTWLRMVAYGGDGDDEIYGGSCSDILLGGRGDDVLYGHHGRDLLEGNQGNDYLDGGDEVDRMRGGDGKDMLDADDSPGYVDIVSGGADSDGFLVNGDNVLDYDPTEDYRL